MVCGASGLGKSTLINSLFLTDVYSAVSKILNLVWMKISNLGLSRAIDANQENPQSRKNPCSFGGKRG